MENTLQNDPDGAIEVEDLDLSYQILERGNNGVYKISLSLEL